MDFNLQNIQFNKGYLVTVFLTLVLSPFVLLLYIYDYNLFERLDISKTILLSICAGGFLYSINLGITTAFFTILDSVSGSQSLYLKDDFDDPSTLGLTLYTISNSVVILNLLRLKIYIHQPKVYWIEASINTWLLTQGILITILIAVIVISHKKPKNIK